MDVRTNDLPDRHWRVAQVAVHSEMDWHTLPAAESLVGDGDEVAHEEAIACAMKGEPSADHKRDTKNPFAKHPLPSPPCRGEAAVSVRPPEAGPARSLSGAEDASCETVAGAHFGS